MLHLSLMVSSVSDILHSALEGFEQAIQQKAGHFDFFFLCHVDNQLFMDLVSGLRPAALQAQDTAESCIFLAAILQRILHQIM